MMRQLSLYTLCIALAIALSAFGAHGLKEMLRPDRILIFSKANDYLLFQCLALMVLVILKDKFNPKYLGIAMNMLFIGMWIFCVSLYFVAFKNLDSLHFLKYFGAIAPIGGSIIVISWVAIAYSFYSHSKKINQ